MKSARPCQVLVVEDEAIVRDYLQCCLEDCGYLVWSAASANEAIVRCNEADHIDLLLTDVHIAGSSGVDLANRLLGQFKNLQVLFISGDASLPPHALAKTQLLKKPFTPDALTNAVQSVLAGETAK